MQDATVGSQDTPTAGYSLHEAAALLGIGVNTLRRRIAAGQVRAEQVQRPQGYVWRVYLDGRHPPTDPADEPPIREAPRSLPHPPTVPAQAEAMVSLIQTTIGTILGPLVGELAASRQANERQAERVAELERENGRQAAELDAARAQISTLEARTEAQPVEPATEPPYSRWRVWEPRLLALVTLAIAVALLVWLW